MFGSIIVYIAVSFLNTVLNYGLNHINVIASDQLSCFDIHSIKLSAQEQGIYRWLERKTHLPKLEMVNKSTTWKHSSPANNYY